MGYQLEHSVFIGYGVALPSTPFREMDDVNAEVNALLSAMPRKEGDAVVEFLGAPNDRQFLLIAEETYPVDPGAMRSVPNYGGGPVEHWIRQLNAAAERLGVVPLSFPSWIVVHLAS